MNLSKAILIAGIAASVVTSRAQNLAPNDPSLTSSLVLWLTDAAANYDPDTGTWSDLSGNGNDAVNVGENANTGITYNAPALVTNATTADANTSALGFGAPLEMMRASNLNGGTGFSEITMFAVYNMVTISGVGNATQLLDRTRPIGIGSSSFEVGNSVPGSFSSNLMLASGPSLRFDNGRIGPGLPPYETGTASPIDGALIRITRMKTGGIFDEWINTDANLNQVLTAVNASTAGTLLTSTRIDELFLGDLRRTDNTSEFEISQIVIFKTALTDEQVAGVNEWIVSNNPVSSGPLQFSVSNAANGTDLDLTWNSQEGKVYDLLSSIDPETDGAPETWTVVANQEGIPAIPPTNTLTIARPADGKRFYAVRERNAPPPPPLFFDNFESDMGWQTGIGTNHTGNTAWELGPPDINFVDGPDSGANGSATCYGTDLDNNYEAGTEVWLRSPEINLTGATGATLSFWHIFDINGAGDETAVVQVLRSSDNSVLGEVETFNTFDLNLLDWFEFSEALPAAALGETIRIEFLFTVDPGATQLFPGWYIDDVMVEVE